MRNVAVVDYGSSNLRSVAKALDHVAGRDFRILVSRDRVEISRADRIVFPGQGAIGQCMAALLDQGFDEIFAECISHKPFLGICLGLQTLLDRSYEDGGTKGFGIIPGTVRKFPDDARDGNSNLYKIPHMGWNTVEDRSEHPLWRQISSADRFYFVHSYYAVPDRKEDIAGNTGYIVEFTSAIARENLFATQFHPEKSQRPGLQLLQNFLHWQP